MQAVNRYHERACQQERRRRPASGRGAGRVVPLLAAAPWAAAGGVCCRRAMPRGEKPRVRRTRPPAGGAEKMCSARAL